MHHIVLEDGSACCLKSGDFFGVADFYLIHHELPYGDCVRRGS